MSRKLAVVVGAAGGQGGSVVAALLKSPETYKVHVITRHPSSDAAKALAAKGVEVISADLNDIDSLIPAFKGTNLIYGVTNFFESFFTESAEKSMEVEYLQGTNIAKAAARTASLGPLHLLDPPGQREADEWRDLGAASVIKESGR